ncbi:MAG: response regulator [Oscillospiraceae bacterium]|nr:response regulator [Oscillospiraceae bacterium]
MVKLFLVEDEVIIRDGIKKHIDWESEGIEFAGEAGDGELALPMILETKPDILITDIKMPFMDGLTLSARVREALPDTEIVVLSGYNDFSYAQQAISVGVTQYILKPITRVRLMECIRPIRDEIEQKRKERQDSIDFDEILSRESIVERLNEFMKTGTETEIPAFFGELQGQIGEANQGSFLFSVYLMSSMYLTMVRFARDLGLSKEELDGKCGSISDMMADMNCNEDGFRYLGAYLKEVIRGRDSRNNRSAGAIRQAVVYIDEHFAEEEISLNRVAAAVNMSPNHFSASFSQEMGQTFIEYLIRRRIDRAKELLMTTDLQSGEICYQVGYRDPQYFSSTFKKAVGMTPTAFRKRGRRR